MEVCGEAVAALHEVDNQVYRCDSLINLVGKFKENCSRIIPSFDKHNKVERRIIKYVYITHYQ